MLVLKLGRKERIDYLGFGPDRRTLVATTRNSTWYWPDVRDGARAELLQSLQWVNHLAFADEGKAIFLGAYRALVRVDLATRKAIELKTLDEAGWPEFDVSPDGSVVLVEEKGEGTLALYPANNLNGGVALWKRKVQSHTRPHFIENGTKFVRLEGHHDGRRDITLVTYDAADGHELAQSPPFAEWLVPAVAAPDGRWFVGPKDSWLCYFPTTAAVGSSGHIKNDNRQHFTGVSFHPSSKHIAATSNDETVKFYATTTSQLSRTFTWAVGRLRCICFSPDGTLAAAGTDKGQVVVWDVDC
jgi:WD40 repeat protein